MGRFAALEHIVQGARSEIGARSVRASHWIKSVALMELPMILPVLLSIVVV